VTPKLAEYSASAGSEVISQLRKLARPLEGRTVVHVNSTRLGGGVAEILMWMIPLMNELGLRASWQVLQGDTEFFNITKSFHNALQGKSIAIKPRLLDHFQDVCRQNAQAMREELQNADFVFIHDLQPVAIAPHIDHRRGKWVWRCHIDVSQPHRPAWKFLRDFIRDYDASIFSLPAFAQPLPHPQYIITPSIDPLSAKNMPLEPAEIESVSESFGLAPDRPVILQVSRFDRFKDPVGVIRAYRMVREHIPVQLVLAGGTASDDPEGERVLGEVREEAGEDPDIHLVVLPPDSHRAINALQRRADLVLQKSLREGFGLSITEAMWKRKPVIGGDTGGIMLQVINEHTGFRVTTPEGAAFRIRYLLNRPTVMASLGETARRLVRENFLLTRNLREYLTVMLMLQGGTGDRLELA
jgi:trehalose synthase